jgi:dethiobiotin synthetase
MARAFLITGTAPRVGKTMVGCALAFAFKVRAMCVGVLKPVQTGCAIGAGGDLILEDANSLIAAASANLKPDIVSPYRYRSALAPAAAALADNAGAPDFEAIVRTCQEMIQISDVVLVEDAGGLAAPIDWEHTWADVGRTCGLELIMVAANRAGFISAATTTLDYAAHRGVSVRGFILNALDAAASATVARDAEFLHRATGARCLGTVRFKEPLALNIVEQLL